jgi:hypothetical protein
LVSVDFTWLLLIFEVTDEFGTKAGSLYSENL